VLATFLACSNSVGNRQRATSNKLLTFVALAVARQHGYDHCGSGGFVLHYGDNNLQEGCSATSWGCSVQLSGIKVIQTRVL
jgi:hypothetical protein